MNRNRQIIGIAVWTMVGAATVTGVIAYKTVYSRPGADALFMLPASAVAVGILDLNPAPSQTLAYKKIELALNRNQLSKPFDSMLFDLPTQGTSKAELIRPYLQRGAVAAYLQDGELKSAVMLLPITDGPEVTKLLKANAKPAFWKGTQYFVMAGGDETGYRVVEDRLVVTEKPWAMTAVIKSAAGEAPRLIDNPDFQTARGLVASDSNFSIFVSPEITKQKDKKSNFRAWMAMGAAVRDQGIELAMDVKMDPETAKEITRLGDVDTLRPDLMKVMPENPMAVFAISNPGEFADSGRKEGQKAGIEVGGDKELQDAFGVSMNDDLVPALKGTSVVGVYPSTNTESMDLVILMDSDHSSKPGSVMQKMADKFEESAKKDNGKSLFAKETVGNAVITKLTEEQQQEIKKGLDDAGKEVGVGKMLKDKTLIMATVNDAAIIASSREMLDRALASYEKKSSAVASGGSFAAAVKELSGGAQFFTTISVAEIAKVVRKTTETEKMDKDGKELYNTMMDALVKLTDPFTTTISVKNDGQIRGRVFMPMDWDLLIDQVGKFHEKSASHDAPAHLGG